MKKTLLIGVNGNMGTNHLRVLEALRYDQQIELKTCDTKGEADYKDFRKALDDYDPEYVIITTPTPTHRGILDACLEKGVENIFVEKPITDGKFEHSMYQCKNIMVGYIETFNPIIKEIKKQIKGKDIDTIICIRSGFEKKEDDYNVDIDLCSHDLSVCFSLFGDKLRLATTHNKNNSCNITLTGNGIDALLHADNKSPEKLREIKLMGKGLMIEGDYINQTLKVNGKEVVVKNQEPLRLELIHFLEKKFTKDELRQSIQISDILRGVK
jgi:predicted dehydrogenase